MKTIIRVIDLETGPDPIEGEPGIIEYGHTDLWTDQHDMLGSPFDWQVGENPFDSMQSLVRPYGPIPPETSAIHNLTDDDVQSSPAWSEVAPCVTLVNNPSERIVALAAHNIECEKNLIGAAAGGLPWIDTYKIALRLWPGSMSHSNNAIRYYLMPTGLIRDRALPTHRALPDSYVTAFTLREALNAGHSVETLIKWTNEPALLPRCKIGEQYRNGGKGTPWEDVEYGMLTWILSKKFDADTLHTARYHLEKRDMDQRLESERQELNRQYRANGMPETASFESATEDLADGRASPNEARTGLEPLVRRDANTMELPL